MRENIIHVFCDRCSGEVVNYTRDNFALDIYSSRDFIIKTQEPRYVCKKCGKLFYELTGLYKEVR